jgi:pimeloyl-ACP methyl ester carboxylesterase
MTAITRHSAAGISYLRCDGGGPMPIVLLHGIGSNAHSFEPLMTALDGSYPTLAWDAPGYGESKPLRVQWPDASRYAEALDRLIARLKITRFILVGHSLGCLMAARYAVMKKEKLAALVLISPATGYHSPPGCTLPPSVAKRIEELDRLGPEKFAAKRAWALLADGSQRADVLEAVRSAMAAVRRPGYDQAARLLATGFIFDDAGKIEVPAAVIKGKKDYATTFWNAHFVYNYVQRISPRYYFRIIDDAGHAVCQEQPAEVARLIVDFVEERVVADA